MSKYCENCFQENLTEWLIDDVGSVFCSEKCFKEFNKNIRNSNDFQIVEDTIK